jgi:quercetin dioxygenase-like cupin family protein
VKVCAAVPHEHVADWEQSPQTLSAGRAVKFHYHDVEEWLTVVRGEITFFTLADEPFHVEVGRALWIPRGEVHRVKVGREGVEYLMFLPIAMEPFTNELTDDERDALGEHLKFPDYEDGRLENGRGFFQGVLSYRLAFCKVDGTVVNKKQFIQQLIDEGFPDKGRSSSGSIRVLNKTDDGCWLISTVVNMTDDRGVRSFTNVRFLAPERRTLRCRLWANYPQLTPDDTMT